MQHLQRRTLLTLTIGEDIEGFPSGTIRLIHQSLTKFTSVKVRSYALLDEDEGTVGGFLAQNDHDAILQGLATMCELLVPEQMINIVESNGVHP